MNTQNYYKDIKYVISLSTDIGTGCKHCSASLVGKKLTESINHYIEEHGYKILHVGTETSHDENGKPWHDTIALLGK